MTVEKLVILKDSIFEIENGFKFIYPPTRQSTSLTQHPPYWLQVYQPPTHYTTHKFTHPTTRPTGVDQWKITDWTLTDCASSSNQNNTSYSKCSYSIETEFICVECNLICRFFIKYFCSKRKASHICWLCHGNIVLVEVEVQSGRVQSVIFHGSAPVDRPLSLTIIINFKTYLLLAKCIGGERP